MSPAAASKLSHVSPKETTKSTAAREEAVKLAEELSARVPTVKVAVAGAPAGETPIITVDGKSGEAIRRVNPGEHKVVATLASRPDARAESSVTLPEPVLPSNGPFTVVNLRSPPELWAFTVPSISEQAMLPEPVFRSRLNCFGTEMRYCTSRLIRPRLNQRLGSVLNLARISTRSPS